MHPTLTVLRHLARVRGDAALVSQVGAEDDKLGQHFLWYSLSGLSMAASAYHGYRRNDSLGWGLGWGALGAAFPIITPTIAVAQGFGKPIHSGA